MSTATAGAAGAPGRPRRVLAGPAAVRRARGPEQGPPRVRPPLEQVDLADPDVWDAGSEQREAAFAALRREAPVRFFDEYAVEGRPAGPG